MPNYYFEIENAKRVYYSVEGTTIPIYRALSSLESTNILNQILASEITNILPVKDNVIKVEFANFMTITVSKEFLKFPDFNSQVNSLTSKILAYIKNLEQEPLKQITEKYNGYVPTINRTKSRNLKTMFVSLGLAGTLFLTGFGVSVKNNSKPEPSKNPVSSSFIEEPDLLTPNIVIEEEIPDNLIAENNNPSPVITEPINENISSDLSYTIDYSFNNEAENGRLDTTKEYFGDLMEYYCHRWGLPTNLCLAQLSQERPSITDGVCKNPYQITYKYFVNQTFKVPVYDENGFTQTYDSFTVTEDSLNSFEGNIMAGLAYLRLCIDNTNSLITGLYLYNQGEPSLRAACNYFGYEVDDYKGDENALAACELITKYNSEKHNGNYGDFNYLANVFRYLPTDDRGAINLDYYLNNQKINIALNNSREYNSNLMR